jgi:hypothetical protein
MVAISSAIGEPTTLNATHALAGRCREHTVAGWKRRNGLAKLVFEKNGNKQMRVVVTFSLSADLLYAFMLCLPSPACFGIR